MKNKQFVYDVLKLKLGHFNHFLEFQIVLLQNIFFLVNIYVLTYCTAQYRVSKCGRTARAIVELLHTPLDPRLVCNQTKTVKNKKKYYQHALSNI